MAICAAQLSLCTLEDFEKRAQKVKIWQSLTSKDSAA